MLPKKQKLTGKDINYMLKRGKRYYGTYMIFWVIPQYANNKYCQRAFQIPLKVDKRAATRNALKRICYDLVKDPKYTGKNIKVFASVNKKQAPELKELIASQDKTAIVKSRKTFIKKDLDYLFSKC